MYAVCTLPSALQPAPASLMYAVSIYGCQATQYSIYILIMLFHNLYQIINLLTVTDIFIIHSLTPITGAVWILHTGFSLLHAELPYRVQLMPAPQVLYPLSRFTDAKPPRDVYIVYNAYTIHIWFLQYFTMLCFCLQYTMNCYAAFCLWQHTSYQRVSCSILHGII